MTTLDNIAIKYGTDKSGNGHSYAKYYDFIFDHIRYKPINLLEIGIDEGNSLRMWKEYFPHSEIHGIDIREGYEYLNGEGIKTHIADHSKEGDLILFGEQYDQYFDVIVEDGSHMSDDSILTFEKLFPYLKSGGYYCVEDLICDYDRRWNKGNSSIEYFKALVNNVNMSGNIPNDHLCSNKIEAVKKYKGSDFDLNIEWAAYFCGLVIVKKI